MSKSSNYRDKKKKKKRRGEDSERTIGYEVETRKGEVENLSENDGISIRELGEIQREIQRETIDKRIRIFCWTNGPINASEWNAKSYRIRI